jgi:putative membrane protein
MNFVISVLIGIALGIISGLVPGLHPNFLGAILLSQINDWWVLPSFITMLVSSRFFEVIRSTFLFVPEEDNVLAMHPIFKFVNEGKSLAAIRLMITGTLTALLIGIIISPILVKLIPILYNLAKEYIPFLLIGIVVLLIIKEKYPLFAVGIFSLSGIIGYFGLKMLNQPLLILLTGFFGFPILFDIKKSKLPKQIKSSKVIIKKDLIWKGNLSAFLSSFFLTFIPAVGPAQASLLSRWLLKKKEEFLISIGAISGFDIIFSTILLFTIGKARIGVLEMLGSKFSISLMMLIVIFALAIATGIFSYLLTLKIGYLFSGLEGRINYTFVKISVILFIITISFYFDGLPGLVFLGLATATGFTANKLRVSMSNCMGSLVIPTLIYYLI